MRTRYYFLLLLVAMTLLVHLAPLDAVAQSSSSSPGLLTNTLEKDVQPNAGSAKADQYSVAQIVGGVINAILSLLGVIFLALLVYGGFKWMTAGGEEEEVTKAKDVIKHAIIGLIIVLAAAAINAFVFESIAQSFKD